MDIKEARVKIEALRSSLLRMKEASSAVDEGMFKDDEVGNPFLEGNADMGSEMPKQSAELHACWEEIQKTVPPGFSIDGNLIRHLRFNQAHDWVDIAKHDVPRELTKIDEYIKQLALVEYTETLHPEVSRVSGIILIGDYDAALKTVYASLDSRIRTYVGGKDEESTVNLIGRAFKDGKLAHERANAARDFLAGVIGYYRNYLLHNKLPTSRNTIEASLSLFALAHEAFKMLDKCTLVRQN